MPGERSLPVHVQTRQKAGDSGGQSDELAHYRRFETVRQTNEYDKGKDNKQTAPVQGRTWLWHAGRQRLSRVLPARRSGS